MLEPVLIRADEERANEEADDATNDIRKKQVDAINHENHPSFRQKRPQVFLLWLHAYTKRD